MIPWHLNSINTCSHTLISTQITLYMTSLGTRSELAGVCDLSSLSVLS